MSQLPEEVIADILSRLPVKPSVQFKPVSIPWRSLIESPNFVELHLNRSIETKSNQTLILRKEQLYSVDFDWLDETHQDYRTEIIKFLLTKGSVELYARNRNGSTSLYILKPSPRDLRDSEFENSLRHAGGSSTKDHIDWFRWKAFILVVVAILIATLAFQAVINPQVDSNGNPVDQLHTFVTAVMAYKGPNICACGFKSVLHLLQKIPKTFTETKGYQNMSIDKQEGLVTVKRTVDVKALTDTLKKQLNRQVEIVLPKEDSIEKKEKGGGDGFGEKGKGGEAGRETSVNGGGELTVSCLLEFVDGPLSSCGDAALWRPFTEDIYMHKSSPQPVALPDEGKIVQLDSFEQSPLVDFDATNNWAYQSSILVPNSEENNMIESSKKLCTTESVLSLVDSATILSSTDFHASDNRAHLSRAHQSGPVVFNSEKKDTREGFNREGLTKSVISSIPVNGGAKNTKRKSRASKRTTTTLITSHPTNFWRMVPQGTGVRFCGRNSQILVAPLLLLKPEPQHLSVNQIQQGCLPAFDMSAFLLDHHHGQEVSPPTATYNLMARSKEELLNDCLPYVLANMKANRDNNKVVKVYARRGGVCWHSMELKQRTTLEELGMDPENKGKISDLLGFVRMKEFYKKAGKDWKKGYLLNGPKDETHFLSRNWVVEIQWNLFWFVRNKEFYKSKGDTWKRVYWLYKPPDTDRSSLSAASANYLKLYICDSDLTSILSKLELKDTLLSTRERSSIVIKDFDFKNESAIGLPDGGHSLPLSEKKIVRKTLKRKCRSMSVNSLVDHQQHVDRRWEDAAKNIAKRICRQLLILCVSIAKRMCRQHGIHHRWPFQQDRGTMKGYTLGDERPIEVIRLSTDGKLVSRLQVIYISWLGRFSPPPSTLPGGEIVGHIALSSSQFATTNSIAQRVGQDQSGSASSDSENERTREQEDLEEMYTSITSDDLRRLCRRMNRKDAAASLGVSIATFKRKCREFGIERWPHVWKKKVGRPPDQHGERNASTACETPLHNVHARMEGEPVGQNQEANEFRRDLMERSIALNTENDSTIAVYSETEAARGSSKWAFQLEGQTMQSTTYPYRNDLVFSQPQIASIEVLNENMGSLQDRRDLLASQVVAPLQESLLEGNVFGFGNWTVGSCSDLAPTQPMHPFSHATGSSENLENLLASVDEHFMGGNVCGSSMSDPALSQPMLTIHHTMATIPHMMPLPTERQDTGSVKIKATYEGSNIKFQFPLTSGIKELKEVMSKILERKLGSFKVEYKDEDGEWILMGLDEHVREYLQLLLGNKVTTELKVQDKVPNTTNFCDNCRCYNRRSLKRKDHKYV